MSKISVIIPTLQKNDKFPLLLENLNNDPVVGEIIIIDNSCKGFPNSFHKVRVISPTQNLYVNPSWNLGVQEARFEYYALFNDDLMIAPNFCSDLYPLLSPKHGIIGMHPKFVLPTSKEDFGGSPTSNKPYLVKAKERVFCFGTIMIGHKSSYFPIPDEIKIFYGDDYLFCLNRHNGRQNYLLSGQTIHHLGSLSSSNPALNNLKEQDLIYYNQIDKKILSQPIGNIIKCKLIKLLCLFIPFKSLRKKLRNYYK